MKTGKTVRRIWAGGALIAYILGNMEVDGKKNVIAHEASLIFLGVCVAQVVTLTLLNRKEQSERNTSATAAANVRK
jgi:hypothetical protein